MLKYNLSIMSSRHSEDVTQPLVLILLWTTCALTSQCYILLHPSSYDSKNRELGLCSGRESETEKSNLQRNVNKERVDRKEKQPGDTEPFLRRRYKCDFQSCVHL